MRLWRPRRRRPLSSPRQWLAQLLPLPWTTRRANLFVEGIALPRRAGDVMAIGDVRLEITVEVEPCERMEESAPGLQAAMRPDWRGGVGCRVLQGGEIAIGDAIRIEERPQ